MLDRYRYNGKEFNEDIGLYEYGFRWYDPALGRFTAADPISDEFAWVSVYNYAENDPVVNIDLHGLQKQHGWVAQLMTYLGIDAGPSPTTRTAPRTAEEAQRQVNFRAAVDGIIDTKRGLDKLEEKAVQLNQRAGDVENSMLVTTIATGGATSEITLPIAGAADITGKFALAAQATIQLVRDGEISEETLEDGFIEVTFTLGGKTATNRLEKSEIFGKSEKSVGAAIMDWFVNIAKGSAKESMPSQQKEEKDTKKQE